MDRPPRFELDYRHDMAASGRQVPCGLASQRPKDLALSGRLAGLKVLWDLERDRRFGREAGVLGAH